MKSSIITPDAGRAWRRKGKAAKRGLFFCSDAVSIATRLRLERLS